MSAERTDDDWELRIAILKELDIDSFRKLLAVEIPEAIDVTDDEILTAMHRARTLVPPGDIGERRARDSQRWLVARGMFTDG